jgi:hypothetical protein
MNAQAGNQGGSELTELLDASLNEKQWRFQLHDPRTDAVHAFPTSEVAVLKAEELGFDFLQGVSAEGAVSQIRKIEGVWRRDDDLLPLSAIQDEIDQGSYKAIVARAEQRAAVGAEGASPEMDMRMATADAVSFRFIQDPGLRVAAAVLISENANKDSRYKAALNNEIPGYGYPGTAEDVDALLQKRSVELEIQSLDVESLFPDQATHSSDLGEHQVLSEPEMAIRARHGVGDDGRSKIVHLDPDAAVRLAREDAQDFGWIPVQQNQSVAFVLAEFMAGNPAYRDELARVAPDMVHTISVKGAYFERKVLGVENLIERGSDASKAVDDDVMEPVKRAVPASDDSISRGAAPAAAVDHKEGGEASKSHAPAALLDGRFVRNDVGEYRRLGEDRLALADEGERIRFVDKQMDAFQAGVELARAKGWETIRVAGSDKFKAEAWFHASSAGLRVEGYEPTEQDLERLGRVDAKTRVSADDMAESLRSAEGFVIDGGSGAQRANVEVGRYSGPIIHQTPHHLVQDIGRGVSAIHEKDRFAPAEVGEMLTTKNPVRIHYMGGTGRVDAKTSERGLAR